MRKAYEEYKATGIQWLPKIPRHWDWSFLSQIADEKKVKKPKNEMFPVMSLSYGRIIKKKNINSGLVPNNYDNYQIISRGDIILRFTDLQNDHTSLRTGLVTEKGIITSAYTNIKPRINSSFLAYLLHAYDNLKIFYGLGGGVRQSIGFKDVRYLQLPIPPREEQEQIVGFLDWKVSSINKLINLKQQEIFELKQSFSSFLTKELTGLSNTTNIPLKRVFSVPMTDGPHETPKLEETGIPFVSAESAHDGRINLKDCRGYISVEQHKVFCKKVKPQRDDIFIVKSGSTTGKTVIVDFDEEFSIWSPLALIRCNDLAIPKYIFYFCTSELFQKQVRDKWSFGTQPNIGMNVLRDLRVLLPSIVDQNSFVLATDKYWKTVQDLIKLIEQQITNLHDIKSSLIADVVTGQIDVRDVEIPDYEQVEKTLDKADGSTLNSDDEMPEEV